MTSIINNQVFSSPSSSCQLCPALIQAYLVHLSSSLTLFHLLTSPALIAITSRACWQPQTSSQLSCHSNVHAQGMPHTTLQHCKGLHPQCIDNMTRSFLVYSIGTWCLGAYVQDKFPQSMAGRGAGRGTGGSGSRASTINRVFQSCHYWHHYLYH